MSRKQALILCLLFLAAVERSGAVGGVFQGAVGHGQSTRPNTWSARSSSGLTLTGTWTAVAGPTSGTVTGTWTLVDAQGRTLRRGGWSAAKSPAGWTGAWRAAISGGNAEYSGTWSAAAGLKADAQFADLFASAVQAVVGGKWRAGRQSGAWSIRAAN